ncbi:Aminotransferase, DegT/DnrJ/EryC1/StrS family protein [Cupriavidus basilensis OR16]|uniref:Aminotransferase, DegT/DnrJ/EryC1/StrS family protein n=1 Tax=Cupriavidus basilensis OR16 TaxID=1127483 RepID=H1RY61_9BURK|nr:GNAT family N-acetyltransferase [Cupriavidus basilensis]EHP44834.1 Aminotransferase, DegT/DnrJ/EryC1/StrS family protein [Cupriavidus basilensis OR16]
MDTRISGKELIASIKASAATSQVGVVIPVGRPVVAVLRPIPTRPGCIAQTDLELLSEWRNRHVKSFLTEFAAHAKRTEQWLVDYVHANPSKLLFMVESLDGTPLGHVGIDFIDWDASYGEADAIVSGGASPRGLMKEALRTMLDWAEHQLGLRHLAVRVRSDNSALEFYRKVGFVEEKRVPLNVERSQDMVRWYEDPAVQDPQAALVYMNYRKQA